MNEKRKAADWLLMAAGTAVLLLGIAVRLVSNSHLGHMMVIVLGILLTAWGLAGPWVRRRIPRWVRAGFCTVLAAGILLAGGLFAYGSTDTVDYTEDAVIVLGAGLRGERVNMLLARRLDTALLYAERNPDAIVVVSGGQGPGEDIPEAEAMARYLVSHGLPEERIVKEAASTSTRENFRYSKAILDTLLPEGYTAAYVTTDYHSYRAGVIAAEEGIPAARISSAMMWYLAPANALREAVAVIKLWTWDRIIQ